MGMGLLDYAEQNPGQEPEKEQRAIRETARTYLERKEAQEEATDLKRRIAQQLEDGSEPQYILYTALRAIGILTNDKTWTDEQTARLDSIYGDLAQGSFLVDNAMIAEERLLEKHKEYTEKAGKQLRQLLKAYKLSTDALEAALMLIDGPYWRESKLAKEQA